MLSVYEHARKTHNALEKLSCGLNIAMTQAQFDARLTGTPILNNFIDYCVI